MLCRVKLFDIAILLVASMCKTLCLYTPGGDPGCRNECKDSGYKI